MIIELAMAAAIGIMSVAVPCQVTQEQIDGAVYEVRRQLNPYVPHGIYEHMEIIYAAGDQEVRLAAEDVVDWVRYWQDGHWDIDDEKIAEFVDSLQEKFDTWDDDKYLHRTEGGLVRIPAGNYGWKLDRKAEIQAISRLLRNNGTTRHSIRFSSEAAEHADPALDYGNSYLEIDLTSQQLWMYLDGKLVLRSNIVSGLMNTDRQTPPGAFGIYYKQSPAVLRGEGYESPVTYWMPFNGGIGLHDATWQYAFGGTYCYTNGSHGCINLPLDMAAKIYPLVKKGFPVLCYYTEEKTENK